MSQDILITPKIGEPQILFRGSGTTDTPIALNVLSSYQSATGSGTAIVFEGTQGQLFGVTDNLSSGTIFSVSDITGLPSLEFLANGELKLGEFGSGVNVYSQNFGVTLSSTGSVATHIPVFIADPSSSVSRLYHRTAAQLRSDIGAGSGNGTVTSVATNNGVTGGTITTTGTIGLTGNALSLHNLATNGVIARTAANTVTARTITGTANQVTVTNGDGVAGNPTLALPQDIHTAATPTFGGGTLNGSLNLRAAATGVAATQIPVFTADPSATTRVLTTRTPAQLLTDIGAQAALTNPITGTGVNGQVSFWTGTNTQGGVDNLFWDNSNVRLGIGTNSPNQSLEVRGNGVRLRLATSSSPTLYYFDIQSNYNAGDTVNFFGTNGHNILKWIYTTSALGLNPGGGNVGVGTSTPDSRFHVNGTSNATIVSIARGAGSQTADLQQWQNSSATALASVSAGGNLSLRAPATGVAATQIPVFTADPASTTRLLVTRTPAELLADIGAQATLTNPVTGTGSNGWVSFWTGTNTQSGDNNLFWNNTNKRLGVGTISPENRLDVIGLVDVRNNMGVAGNFESSAIRIRTQNTVDNTGWQGIRFDTSTTANYGWALGINRTSAGYGSFKIYEHHNDISGVERFTILPSGEVILNANINLRALATGVAATQIPVFTADPASTTRLLVTRTPAQLRSDIGAGTGNGTVTSIATNNGVTGGTITGAGTIGLTGNALSLHNLATNGIVARTAANTVTARTITGTANQVTVTNGDGVAGNPTLALPQNIHTTATPTFGATTINGSIGIRANSTASTTTQIPVFTADPSATTRILTTRTPAQLRSDMQAVSTTDSRLGVIYDPANDQWVSMLDDEWTFPSTLSAENLRLAIDAVGSIPVANASGVDNIMVMSEATYNALSPKDANTLYFLTYNGQ